MATVGIVMIAPAPGRQQDHSKTGGADQRSEIMRDVLLAARILQARRHPAHDAAAFENTAQHHRAGVTGQTIGPACLMTFVGS